jgi:hypothetical protein
VSVSVASSKAVGLLSRARQTTKATTTGNNDTNGQKRKRQNQIQQVQS